MPNTGFKGVDVRQTNGNGLIFRALLQDTSGILVTGGSTSLYLYEIQSDSTLNSYDWNTHVFTSGILISETNSMTHRKGNGNTTNTGIWTYCLPNASGFSMSGVYLARVNNNNSFPNDQTREFQFGSEQGDVLVHSTYGVKSDFHGYVGGNPSGLADSILMRNVSGIEANMPEHSLGTIILATLENTISGTTLTIRRTDGSTTHITKTLSTDAAADPITGIQ